MLLGCTKTDLSRWRHRPFSTHRLAKEHKLAVVKSAAALFHLSEAQAENLANKAGLSLHARENALAPLLKNCGSIRRRQIYHMIVGERMIQYYINGREPAKYTLLAIGILLELPLSDLELLLKKYGCCISPSLANDAIIRWFLTQEKTTSGIQALYFMNETLEQFKLPLLMAGQNS